MCLIAQAKIWRGKKQKMSLTTNRALYNYRSSKKISMMHASLTTILIALVFTFFITTGAVAEDSAKQDSVIIHRVNTEAAAVCIPLRSTLETMGGIVEWDDNTGIILAVTSGGTTFSYVPGSKTARINGIDRDLLKPSVTINGSTYFTLSDLENILDIGCDTGPTTLDDEKHKMYVEELLNFKSESYYWPENLLRYIDYKKDHRDLSYDKVMAYVNVDVDKECYAGMNPVPDPESITVMCNKHYYLPDNYIPSLMLYMDGTSHQLRSEAAEQYCQMQNAANKEGLNLKIASAYRSYNVQRSLYYGYVQVYGNDRANEFSARPGHSEHQTGLAIDVVHYSGSRLSQSNFQNTEEYQWLLEHAYKYGFILRYPEGYEDITGYMYEPWHWRYVGLETAAQMHNEGITTLEEYCGKYLF